MSADTLREKAPLPGVDYGSIMHIVLSDGLRVGIMSLMATVRAPVLKYRGVSSQQGPQGLREARTGGGCTVRPRPS